MAKIDIRDIQQSSARINPDTPAFPNTGFFSPQGIKQFKDIIEGIKEMLQQAKELKSNPTEPPDRKNNLDTNQLIEFGKHFLDSMIQQGYGNKSLAETIDAIPFTINQIRGLIK